MTLYFVKDMFLLINLVSLFYKETYIRYPDTFLHILVSVHQGNVVTQNALMLYYINIEKFGTLRNL